MVSLLPLGAPPSDPAALLLLRRLCPLTRPRSDPKEFPATRLHPAGHGLDQDSDENPLDCRGHHRLPGSWSSDLRWSDRYILGNACAITIERCLEKKAIVPGSHSDGSHSAGEQVLNPLPLIITESVASVVIRLHLNGERKQYFLTEEKETPQTIKW